MSTDQQPTVTLATEDFGPVTLPEPPWCDGHADHRSASLRVDLTHAGPAVDCVHRGHTLFSAEIVQHPFSTSSSPELGGRTPGVSVWPLNRTLDPVQLYGLAADLDRYADQLRGLADQLTALLGEGQ